MGKRSRASNGPALTLYALEIIHYERIHSCSLTISSRVGRNRNRPFLAVPPNDG